MDNIFDYPKRNFLESGAEEGKLLWT